MTDINKLKLLINAEIIENRSYYALFNEGMKKGAEIAQSIILHQNRWRKVEEELPEYYKQVLVKSKDSESVICAWLACMDSEEFMFTICGTDILISIDDVDEWKPII